MSQHLYCMCMSRSSYSSSNHLEMFGFQRGNLSYIGMIQDSWFFPPELLAVCAYVAGRYSMMIEGRQGECVCVCMCVCGGREAERKKRKIKNKLKRNSGQCSFCTNLSGSMVVDGWLWWWLWWLWWWLCDWCWIRTISFNLFTVCLSSSIVFSRRLNCPHVGHWLSKSGHCFK